MSAAWYVLLLISAVVVNANGCYRKLTKLGDRFYHIVLLTNPAPSPSCFLTADFGVQRPECISIYWLVLWELANSHYYAITKWATNTRFLAFSYTSCPQPVYCFCDWNMAKRFIGKQVKFFCPRDWEAGWTNGIGKIVSWWNFPVAISATMQNCFNPEFTSKP